MVKIREAVREDLCSLSNLFWQLMGNESDLEQMKLTFDKVQNDGSYILLVAEYKGKVVGTVMGILCYDLVEQCRPFMVVENVIIDEAIRGLGAGKLLMNALEEKARIHDVTYMMLLSAAKREGAHKFYEAVGYEKDCVVGFKKYL